MVAWYTEKKDCAFRLVTLVCRAVPKSFRPADRNALARLCSTIDPSAYELCPTVCSYIVPNIIQQVLCYVTSQQTDTETQPPQECDSGALYYVAGAVLQSLRKRYNEFSELISSFTVSEPSNTDAEWTSKRNRGGLIYPAEEFHEFVILVDSCISSHLPKCKLSLDLRNTILDILIGNDKVCLQWERLAHTISHRDQERLLIRVLNHLTNIRLKAYANHKYRVYRKENPTAGKKGQKSLRKQLKLNSDASSV